MIDWKQGLVAIGCVVFFGMLAVASTPGKYLVSEVKGAVKVQRKNQTIQTIYPGNLLQATDIILLPKGGWVGVLCPNAKHWTPGKDGKLRKDGKFEVAKGCGVAARNLIKAYSSDRIPTRSLNDPAIPYLISPRQTRLVNAKPLFRWNEVAGAKEYAVSVTGPNGLEWETTVQQSQARYEGDQPIVPDNRYRVTVTADTGASSMNDTVGFSWLKDTSVREIRSDIQLIEQQDLNPEAKVLAIAHLEAGNELFSDAIDRLEAYLNQGNSSEAGYQLLGDLYWQVGLPGLARQSYMTAQKLMKQNKNRLGEAEVLRQLGEVERVLGELPAAIAWLEAAKPIYQELGDREQVQAIEATLADLRQRV